MNAMPPRLGEWLCRHGQLSQDQLHIALREQQQRPALLGHHLLALGFLDEGRLNDALSTLLDVPLARLAQTVPDPAALARVPEALARAHRALPLAWDAARACLSLAMARPQDLIALDRIAQQASGPMTLRPMLASDNDIEQGIDRYYGRALAIDDILGEMDSEGARRGETAPTIRLVDALLTDAVKRQASDLHFEPEAAFLRIRYRIDGVLCPVRTLHAAFWPALAVRLKLLCGMDIAESRAAQDGRFSIQVAGRPIDIRGAVLPTLHGENIVLRLLDRARAVLPLHALGLDPAQRDALDALLARPEGLILVTGPTGSGKTTTLYAMLSQLNTPEVNIMTLEDPVEYPLPGLRQTAVSEHGKLGFAEGIRALLRQDPDILLVGEIRDSDTATLALRAAMTGHRVLATLHCPSALGAIPRLRDLGIAADLLADNLTGIIAQRLVRRLCPHCRLPAPADDPAPFVAAGCPACEQRGYHGRLPVMEIVPVTPPLGEAIGQDAGMAALRQIAQQQGLQTLAEAGRRHARAGHTSLAELQRVVDLGPCHA